MTPLLALARQEALDDACSTESLKETLQAPSCHGFPIPRLKFKGIYPSGSDGVLKFTQISGVGPKLLGNGNYKVYKVHKVQPQPDR